MVNGLFIDIFGLAFVGLENDIGTGSFQSVFERRILVSAFEPLRDIAIVGDDTNKSVARFGVGRDVIGEKIGVLVIADNDGTQSTNMALGDLATNEAQNSAKNSKSEKTEDGGVNGDNADREKVALIKKVKSNDKHDADNRGDEEAPSFFDTGFAKEDGFLIKAEEGENDNPGRDKREDSKGEFQRCRLKSVGTLVNMSASIISKHKGRHKSEGVTKH